MRRTDVFVALAGVAAAALLGETLLALFWPQRSASTLGMFEPDPNAGYRLRSEFENEVRVPEYSTAIRTDASGHRVPAGSAQRGGAAEQGGAASAESASACRQLLAIGDSFTFGVGVNAEEAFPLRLESILEERTREPWCATNAGVGGYGPLRSARLLTARESGAHPEILIHAVYVGNDLEDSNPATILREPTIEQGRMVGRKQDVIARTRRFLRIHSHLYSFLRANFYDFYAQTPFAARSQYLDPTALARWPESIERVTWPAARDALRSIDAWAQANGARSLVVLVPTKYQVEDAAWATYKKRWKLGDEAFDRDHAQRVLRELTDAENIVCCDLLPVFRAAAARGESLYYRVDTHWTPQGHALAAEAIAREIDSRGWISHGLTGALAAGE